MGNKSKKEENTKIKKIKIRLADPNTPNSYVCEIFDSSLEKEDESDFPEHFESQNTLELIDDSKPKNYFEILMSNDNKKNSAKDIEYNETKFMEINNKSQKLRKKKNKKLVVQLGNHKEEKQCYTDSSEDDDNESLLQIQNRYKSQVYDEKVNSTENLTFSKQPDLEVLYRSCDMTKKKSSNILNYFSKIQDVTPKNLSNKIKENKLNVTIDKNSYKNSPIVKSTKIDSEIKSDHIDPRKSISNLNKENIKLAPLFIKKEKKVLDLDTQRSRLEFLHKGLPFTQKKCKINNGDTNGFNFPVISHIQQKSDSVYWSIRQVTLPFINISHEKENTWQHNKEFFININHCSKPFFTPFENLVLKDGINFNKETLKSIKSKYLNLNLDLIIDGFKQKKDNFLKCANHSKNYLNNEYGLEIDNTLWCEKYKPSSHEILGNMSVVNKLRKWLESWKTFDTELKKLAKSSQEVENKEKNNKYDSDEESDFFETDESYGLKSPNNVCLLSGPNGCGKTTLVHAIANELDFNILEVNASSKRTGKIVLSDLQEATQSHKFHHSTLSSYETKPQTKKNRKSKISKKSKNSKTNLDQINSCKISLILIEDADIVFEEHDEGFCSAVTSLVQTSKRPLIFLTNDPSCVLLDVFKSDQFLMLEMDRPNFNLSCAVLDIVTLLEGVNVNKETIEFLVRQNRSDLRKSLLEMQFWIQCNERATIPQLLDLGNLWWGLFQFLFNQDIRHFEKHRRPKRKRSNNLFDSSDEDGSNEVVTKKLKLNSRNPENCYNIENVLIKTSSTIHSYFNVLDLVSSLDAFRLSNNQEPIPIIDYKPKDSLSLEENLEDVTWSQTNLTEKICSDLIDMCTRSFSKKVNTKNKISFLPPSWKEIRWRMLQDKANEELSVLVPLHNIKDKRSVYLDYLPFLRNMCRNERNRFTANNKRKNRFYHYLNNLGVEISEENLIRNCEILECQ